ncbi:MAG: hypothetical protein HQM12_12875, partial [SAR324 cluster bacterium]|nr:hypothetical protein [SAR324 cluster bacterium]
MLIPDLQIPPHQIFAFLHQTQSKAVFLESSVLHPDHGRYSIITSSPETEVYLHNGILHVMEEPPIPGNFEAMARVVRSWLNKYPEMKSATPPPYFTGGVIGFVSYDINRYLYDGHQVGKVSSWPEGCFRLYRWSLVYDHQQQQYSVHGVPPFDIRELNRISENREQ